MKTNKALIVFSFGCLFSLTSFVCNAQGSDRGGVGNGGTSITLNSLWSVSSFDAMNTVYENDIMSVSIENEYGVVVYSNNLDASVDLSELVDSLNLALGVYRVVKTTVAREVIFDDIFVVD